MESAETEMLTGERLNAYFSKCISTGQRSGYIMVFIIRRMTSLVREKAKQYIVQNTSPLTKHV